MALRESLWSERFAECDDDDDDDDDDEDDDDDDDDDDGGGDDDEEEEEEEEEDDDDDDDDDDGYSSCFLLKPNPEVTSEWCPSHFWSVGAILRQESFHPSIRDLNLDWISQNNPTLLRCSRNWSEIPLVESVT